MKTQILLIVGARPQFIKASVILHTLRQTLGLDAKLLHSGQHYDKHLSGVFFNELDLPTPDYHFEALVCDRHQMQVGRMVRQIERVLLEDGAGHVVVVGDTNTTLAGALAAAKLEIPLSHIEAGLRSFDRGMPEETNRVVTDHLSALLFPPTPTAVANLANEGITRNVHLVGDVLYDAVSMLAMVARKNSRITEKLRLVSGEYVLATVHRAASTDSPELSS